MPTTEHSDVWRRSAPHVVAALTRRYGDFDAAEDAAQEALLAAARQWPEHGVPDDPTAWLIRVASRRLVDQWRAQSARTERERRVAREPSGSAGREVDDSLTVFFLCCHPALNRPAQLALTLRAVGGLSTAQLAHAFLVPEPTMAQRVSRAKARLAAAGARFEPPTPAELPARVDTVAQVLYVIFTAGHTTSAGPQLYDVSLTAEAIRLTRLLHDLLPSHPEVTGLLALMLLTDARRAARLAADGSLVPLAEQDRTRWDRAAIAEGIALVEAALPRGPVGPFQLQAAIAAVHAEAGTAEATDWPQIAELYRLLARHAPSPVVTVNRAVAVAMVDGPAAALELLAPLQDDPQARRHHRLHAVRGHLLEQHGDRAAALEAYTLAARLTASIPEQRYLNAAVLRLRSSTR